MVTLSVLPFIERELEEAINQCKAKCPPEGCTDKAVNVVDTAASLYFGSLEDGSGKGQLMSALATRECGQFRTCGANGDATSGSSKVDIEILHEFQSMQANLTTRACQEARGRKDHIQKWMKVPLIQGTLRHAYMRFKGEASDADVGTGAAFSASIVPFVAACSYTDAEIIDNNLETMAKSTNFTLVKETLEKHYSCLGVRCQDIGGYWDHAKSKYHVGAGPCNFDVVKPAEAPQKKGMGWGLGLTLFFVVAVVIVIRRRRRTAQRKKARSGTMDDFSDSSEESDSPHFT
jgi:hypothetical protein